MTVRFGLLGSGRIGRIHASNIVKHAGATLKYVVDTDDVSAAEVATDNDAVVADTEAVLGDPEVTAIIIATSTDTHADLIIAAARAGKAVFCEKPIDLSVQQIQDCLRVVDETNILLGVGFNRRFDPSVIALREAVLSGRVGSVEIISITSRDPSPPPASYIAKSGGIFKDMMIHDFDMARWLLGEEPDSIFAVGSCLIDQSIGAAGDFDSAVAVLKTGSGRICHISNSRRTTYGYDQRIEVFGSEGAVSTKNILENLVVTRTSVGQTHSNPVHFFLERYCAAYEHELNAFIAAVAGDGEFPVTGVDGLRALQLAEAADLSIRNAAAVHLSFEASE